VHGQAHGGAPRQVARRLRDERGREQRVRPRADPARPKPPDPPPQLGRVVDVDEHRAGGKAAREAPVGPRPDRQHDAPGREVRRLVEDAGQRMGRQSLEHRVEHEHGGHGGDRCSAWDLHRGLDHPRGIVRALATI
jgi:hypothetical protein